MLEKIKSLFSKTETAEELTKSIDNTKLLQFISEQDAENRGLRFGYQQMQFKIDEMQCVIASLMLDSGKTEYSIKQEFFNKFLAGDMVVASEIEDDNVKIWLEKRETCKNCGGDCEDCE